MLFLLLNGADRWEVTVTGQSALDLANLANKSGSHDQVIALLKSPRLEEDAVPEYLLAPEESDDDHDNEFPAQGV